MTRVLYRFIGLGVLLLLLSGCQPTTPETFVTVVFDTLCGETVPEVTLLAGQRLTETQTSKEGFRFLGWYTSPSFDTRWVFESDVVNEDMTLYARWQIMTFRIDFNVVGGSIITPQIFGFGSVLPDFTSQKEGYTFLGWSPALPEAMPAENLEVTALWEVNAYTLTLLIQGKTLGSFGDLVVAEGETVIQTEMGGLHSAVLTSQGRVFTWGWNHQGQLGDGSVVNRHRPVDITERFSLLGNEQILRLSLGGAHSAALTTQGRVFLWGWNAMGNLETMSQEDKHPL